MKGKGKNKRHKILEVLENLKSVFTGVYLHYKDVPKETMFERSIAERIKSRKGKWNWKKRTERKQWIV